MANYKSCSVPMCKSTTIKCPEKLFIHVPMCPIRRKQWLQLARRDAKFSDKSTIFFCQDHFDLHNDMENYIRYRLMGSVGLIRMKKDCLPSKFDCQPDSFKRSALSPPESAESKRQRMNNLEDTFSPECDMPATSGMTLNNDVHSITAVDNCYPTVKTEDKTTQVCPEVTNSIIQVCLKSKFRSKAIQTVKQVKDKNMSPIKTNITCTATSPLRISKPGVQSANYIEQFRKKQFFCSESPDISSSSSSSPSKHSQYNTETDTSSVQSLHRMTSNSTDQETQTELSEIKRKVEAKDLCQRTIELTVCYIKKNPKYYIGIPKECYFLVDLIQRHTKLPEQHILLCLKKIRLNTPFSELADQFGICVSYVSRIFMKSVPLISSVLHPFIIKPNNRTIKKNLPMAFRHKYNNIYCIIDCLEIEIQKPSKAVEQALSWSEYKKANTAKYLISSTPDGIINYISPGFSGRVTDVILFQDCNFLDYLEPGVSILADRGFKHLEEILLDKDINLVRPPSVSSNSKLSKQDVIKTKQIASLRIHIERVIRRLREFSMLKPHSVVHRKLLKYLDDCCVIACGLINLQDSIIKNT